MEAARETARRIRAGRVRPEGNGVSAAIPTRARRTPRRVARVAGVVGTGALLLAGGTARADASGAAEATTGEGGESMIVAPSAEPATREALLETLHALGPDHAPRTGHFLADGRPRYLNRLVREDSPYLLQHAHNPVDWFPWGEEAFARARGEDRPVFLSIGYATCHWCHVMERESFENEAIARLLNDYFVPVKVDREQLPDVDALYMTAVRMLTGGGGWPMSSFLDTEGRPFFGGTYFPPDRFADLLDRVSRVWATDQGALLESAAEVADALERVNRLAERTREVGEAEIALARRALLENLDAEHGGFGRAPKFPQEATLLFLLDQARRAGDGEALAAADLTLRRMASGGIHDQIGGGFHRYAVDHRWQVPHFEKMLYNQASLARAYALGWQLTGEAEHERTARGILDYVLREMTTREGLFHSATDADSEGREGAYFVWTPETLEAALGDARDVEIAAALWGVDEVGNFEHGETVLHRPEPLGRVAERLGMTPGALLERRESLAERLREARAEREPPLLDDKILSGWNGLMITAFAEAGVAFDERRYLGAARRAADALWATAWDEAIGLSRSRFRGESGIAARQTDHAWLAEAMLALHDAEGVRVAPGEPHDGRWLERARRLADAMLERFLDEEEGGFFLGAASVGGAALVARPKDIDDASTPSGNGVALRVLTRLAARTGETRYREEAERLVDAFAGTLARRRGGLSTLLLGLAEHLDGESGATRYSERGTARVAGRAGADGRVEILIDLADGWHLNSATPLQDYLIPTTLATADGTPLAEVRYPESVERRLAFQSETLSLYEGEVTISADLPPAREGQTIAPVTVRLQSCSDEICLAPESLTLNVSTAALR